MSVGDQSTVARRSEPGGNEAKQVQFKSRFIFNLKLKKSTSRCFKRVGRYEFTAKNSVIKLKTMMTQWLNGRW